MDEFKSMSYYGNKQHDEQIESVLIDRKGAYENKSQFINTAVAILLRIEEHLKNLSGYDYIKERMKVLGVEKLDGKSVRNEETN